MVVNVMTVGTENFTSIVADISNKVYLYFVPLQVWFFS